MRERERCDPRQRQLNARCEEDREKDKASKGKSHSNPNPTWDPEYDEKMAMASRADGNYTDDASLKQPHTLTMDDSDEIGGVRV